MQTRFQDLLRQHGVTSGLYLAITTARKHKEEEIQKRQQMKPPLINLQIKV